ncbi:MAG: PAS domain S-box protein [Nitrospirales bacterium]|nr:MAG: PAS domain S-box protein [Nitrospirales bacterium]
MMNSNWISCMFKNSKLSTRFTIISVMFLSVLLGMSIYTMTTLQKDRSNALVIDMAGRQRMLLQRHVNEVLLTRQGVPADYASTRELILSTLNALMVGGSVALNPETDQWQTIPAAPTKEIFEKLQEQQDHIKRIFQLADQFLLLSPDDPEFRPQLLPLRNQHSLAIRMADEAVKQLNNYSEAAITRMVKWEVIIAIIVGWLGVFVTTKGVQDGRKIEKEVEERKLIESALRDSQAFLNSIVENIPHMIFVKDARDLQFLRLNKAGEELVGYPRERMIGKTDYNFFPKPEADSFTTKDREVLAGKTLVDIPEEVIQTKSQGARYLRTKKIPILDDDGNPQYLLGISEDITEQKLAKLEHTERELLLRLIFETGPGCIKRVAADGTLLHMNPAGLEFIEAEGENEVRGLSVFDLVVPEHLGAYRHMHQNVLQGKQQTLQFEVQGLKGGRRWMETYAVPFRNPLTNEVEQLAVTHDITKRKATEEVIRKGEQKFRVMAETVPDIVFTNQPDGSCDFVNQRLYEYTGLASDSALGFGWTKALHPDDLERSKDKWLGAMNADFPYEDRYRMISPNGTYRWFMARAIPVKNAKGQIEKWFGVSTDIQDLVKAETTLRTTEQMYRQILDSISDMVLVKDRNFRILWANKAFRSYYNMTNEELKGILDSPINEPDFTKRYNEDDSYVFNTGEILDIPEEPVTRHDGHVVFFHTIKAPLLGESGEVVKSVGVSRDITERKRAEEIIRKGERKFRAIYEQAPTGIAVLDSLNGRFTQINQTYCDITGYSQEEMLNQTFQNITHPDDLQADLEQMQQLLTGQIKNFQMEKRIIRKDGKVIWVKLTCVPLWLEPTDSRQHIAMSQTSPIGSWR